MTTAFAPSLSFLLLLFTGARLDLPLSLPPLPEDSRLAYAAPEKCLWYLATSGVAPADPKSKNHVEQMLAEEDVQRFQHEVSTKLKEAFAKATPNDPVRKLLGEEVPKLVELLLTRPLCAYIESIGASPQGPTFRGGLAVSLDTRAEEVKTSLEKIEQTLFKLANKPIETNDGWHKLPLPPGAPVIQWGVQEKFFVVGMGENRAGSLLSRLKTSKTAPEWLAKIRRELKVERPSVVQFVNVAEGLKLLQPAIAMMHGPDQTRRIMETFGLSNVKSYASVAGLDGEEFASRALLATDGKPAGLFALLDGPALDAKSLAIIPDEVTFAVAKRIDAAKAIDLLTQIAAVFGPPDMPNPVTEGIKEFQTKMGVDLRTEIIAALGDTWCLYNSPDDGGLLFTGLTLTVNIRDREKLQKTYDKLIAVSKQIAEAQPAVDPNGQPRPVQKQVAYEYRGQTIHFGEVVGQATPVAPALCITDTHVIFSLFPQAIKSHLDRQATAASKSATATPAQSLASSPIVAKQLEQKDGAVSLVYQNTPAFAKFAYPFAQIGMSMACGKLQENGIDLNIGMFPNARAILPHMVPTVTSLRGTNEGVLIETRGSVPMGAGMLPLAAIVFGVRSSPVFPTPGDDPFGGPPAAMPAASLNIGVAPGFAEREASKNKLKQIALGMLNFENVKKSFPQAAIVDKENKPLLSWRVAILPFLDQKALFDQFKLDEPWDSEHNKKLIEKMPDIYKAPGSKVAGEFKTVYETVRGERTVFPIERAIRLRGITDGTSRTVMAVETSDDKAVIWTKPDDFEPDENNPAAGLVGLREDRFLAVLCDGRAIGILGNTEKGIIKAIFTRNGGETNNLDGVVE